MKIFVFIAIFFVLIGCRATPEVNPEKFVNPIFYKTMHPLGTASYPWDLILTPTKMVFHNTKTDTKVEQNCYLTKNTEMSITLNCEDVYAPPDREQVVCTRMPEEDEPYFEGMYVRCKTTYQHRKSNYDADDADYDSMNPYVIDFD